MNIFFVTSLFSWVTTPLTQEKPSLVSMNCYMLIQADGDCGCCSSWIPLVVHLCNTHRPHTLFNSKWNKLIYSFQFKLRNQAVTVPPLSGATHMQNSDMWIVTALTIDEFLWLVLPRQQGPQCDHKTISATPHRYKHRAVLVSERWHIKMTGFMSVSLFLSLLMKQHNISCGVDRVRLWTCVDLGLCQVQTLLILPDHRTLNSSRLLEILCRPHGSNTFDVLNQT